MSRRAPDLGEIADILARFDFHRNNHYINEKTFNQWKAKNPNSKLSLKTEDVNDDGIPDSIVVNSKGKLVSVNGWQVKKTDFPYRNLMKNNNPADRNVKAFIKNYYNSGKAGFDVDTGNYAHDLTDWQQENERGFEAAKLSRKPKKMNAMRYYNTFIFHDIYDAVFPKPEKGKHDEENEQKRNIRKETVPYLLASAACFRQIRKDVINSLAAQKHVDVSNEKEFLTFICDLKATDAYKNTMLKYVIDNVKELALGAGRALKFFAQNPKKMREDPSEAIYGATWGSVNDEREKKTWRRKKGGSYDVSDVQVGQIGQADDDAWDINNPEHRAAAAKHADRYQQAERPRPTDWSTPQKWEGSASNPFDLDSYIAAGMPARPSAGRFKSRAPLTYEQQVRARVLERLDELKEIGEPTAEDLKHRDIIAFLAGERPIPGWFYHAVSERANGDADEGEEATKKDLSKAVEKAVEVKTETEATREETRGATGGATGGATAAGGGGGGRKGAGTGRRRAPGFKKPSVEDE
jgi:hypothetical protein